MSEDRQTRFALLVVDLLNQGSLQDAVVAGLEDQGQFRLDTLDLLDALRSAGLKLVPDDGELAADPDLAIRPPDGPLA